MESTTGSLPNLARTDISDVVVDRWFTPDPAEQDDVSDVVVRAWLERGLPSGLASVTCLPSMRGDVVLTYQQWTDHQAQQRCSSLTDGVETSGLRRETATYVPYRNVIFTEPRPTGCLVVTTFEFASTPRAQEWADLLIGALQSLTSPIPGLLAQHLHLGLDTPTVLNCSEWIRAEDHHAFIEAPTSDAAWQRIDEFQGAVHGPGARCRIGAVLHATTE